MVVTGIMQNFFVKDLRILSIVEFIVIQIVGIDFTCIWRIMRNPINEKN